MSNALLTVGGFEPFSTLDGTAPKCYPHLFRVKTGETVCKGEPVKMVDNGSTVDVESAAGAVAGPVFGVAASDIIVASATNNGLLVWPASLLTFVIQCNDTLDADFQLKTFDWYLGAHTHTVGPHSADRVHAATFLDGSDAGTDHGFKVLRFAPENDGSSLDYAWVIGVFNEASFVTGAAGIADA